MPEDVDFITPGQYTQYTDAWAALIKSKNNDILRQAFQAPNGKHLCFLNFSLDQLFELVTATDVYCIKARFLLWYDAINVAHFSVTLFAADDKGNCLSKYYIPTSAAPTITQPVEPLPGPGTNISIYQAKQWLESWLSYKELTTSLFCIDGIVLQGSTFEVSTFQDPLAAAQPYANKSLFFNLGLNTDNPELQVPAAVVYIGMLDSRQQGTLAGLPTDDCFYDMAKPSPPGVDGESIISC